MNFLHKISDAVDNAADSAREAVLKLLEPQIREQISERVDDFKDKSVRELPETCEDEVKKQSEDNFVAKLLDKMLGDNTSELVSKLVTKMQPGIDSSTAGLSDRATQFVMERLSAAFEDDNSDDEDDSEPVQSEKPAVRRTMRHANKLNDHLQDIEISTRKKLHPLFVQLQTAIQQLVPEALRDAVNDEVTASKDVADRDEDDSRGLLSMLSNGADSVKDWLKETSQPALQQAVEMLIKAVDGPVNRKIAELVGELEQRSTNAAFAAVRTQLASFHIIGKQQAAFS